MKGHKGEGAKQSQVKGASGAAERGPLFPRLHVNETEKAGPKAPPRNKMALYEQFTVPSHRFVQPSQKPASTIYQQQYGTRELGYPYVPYYMPSVPYANTNHGVPMYAQPSQNTSSSGVTISSGVVNEELGRNAPRHHKSGELSPCRVSRHLTESTADCTAKSLPEQKGKVTIVPAQSAVTNQAEESSSSLQNVPSDMVSTDITDITESLQEVLSTVDVGTECTGTDVKRRERVLGSVNSSRSTDEGKMKQAAQLSIFEILTKPTKEGASDKSTVQSCLQTESTRDVDCVTQALTSHVHCNIGSGTSIEPKDLEEIMTTIADGQSFLSSENQAIVGPQSTSDAILKKSVHRNAFKKFTTDRTGGFSNPSFDSSEELKNFQNRSIEISQPSQCGTHKEGPSDGLIVPSTSLDSMWAIKPKHVICAIGQQQFWKARKKLLRQQRIFSDQVFQLHKLIKVQQLLAETPGTLIDDEMHFETIEEFDATASLAKIATSSGEDANKVGFNFKEGSKGKAPEAEGQSKNNWGQTQADGNVGLGSNASMPEFSSVGVSAWGYPSLGPWGGPMAAHGGPFNYQQFTGTLPPGSAFGLPFGPSLPGSGAPMMSFGIPYCGRRQELPAEMDSNYGPPTAFKHEGSGTVSVNSNHVSNDLAASCYFSQYNSLNNNRLPAARSSNDVPTGSGTSVNKSSATMQALKTSCFPGLSYQWGLNCQTGPLNTDGLDNSAHQSENSSPSNATRLNCRTSSTPSTPPARRPGLIHQDAEGLAKNLDPASGYGFNSSDQYDSGKKLAGKEKLVTSTPSHSKRQKESVCFSIDGPPSNGNNYGSGVNHSALDLFPLVPSLSSGGGNGKKVLKAVEEGQGVVIRAVPRRATAASKSAAGILLSLQRERQK